MQAECGDQPRAGALVEWATQHSGAPRRPRWHRGSEEQHPLAPQTGSQAGAVPTGLARRACRDRFFQAPAGARQRSRSSQQHQPTGPMLAAQRHFPLPRLCLGGDPTKFTCGTRENTVEVLGRQDWEGWRHSQQRRESSRGVSGQRGPHEQRQAENRGGKHGNTGSREGVQRCWVWAACAGGSGQPLHLLLASRAGGGPAAQWPNPAAAATRHRAGQSVAAAAASHQQRALADEAGDDVRVQVRGRAAVLVVAWGTGQGGREGGEGNSGHGARERAVQRFHKVPCQPAQRPRAPPIQQHPPTQWPASPLTALLHGHHAAHADGAAAVGHAPAEVVDAARLVLACSAERASRRMPSALQREEGPSWRACALSHMRQLPGHPH